MMTNKTNESQTLIKDVAIYARASTHEQTGPVEAQLATLRSWAEERGCIVTKEYVESDCIAPNLDDDKLPTFHQMVADTLAAPDKVNAILVTHTSRFCRNATRSRILKAMLREKGVRVIAIEQETTDDPMGRFLDGIFELFNELRSSYPQ